ncbi:MAG: D-alanine--D-alanine ligase [Gemmatimonadota bacterium]
MRIGVLMGGTSDERDVSLASGVEVAAALREAGHEVVTIDTTRGVLSSAEERALRRGGVSETPPASDTLPALRAEEASLLSRPAETADVDVFFLALHGGAGEDGTLQALLDMTGVAYTGSSALGCGLAMDKEVTKRLLRDAGVGTPDWLVGPQDVEEVVDQLGLPVIVKAAAGGSSLRLALAHDREELGAVIAESASWDDIVLFERYHPGREFTVAIVGDETFPVGEVIPHGEFFDYESKYQPGMAQEIFPADIPETLSDELRELARRVHAALRLRDVSRIDFIVDEDGSIWCLEANALPGMTANSLVPKAASAAGISFPALCDRIARLASARGTPHASTT